MFFTVRQLSGVFVPSWSEALPKPHFIDHGSILEICWRNCVYFLETAGHSDYCTFFQWKTIVFEGQQAYYFHTFWPCLKSSASGNHFLTFLIDFGSPGIPFWNSRPLFLTLCFQHYAWTANRHRNDPNMDLHGGGFESARGFHSPPSESLPY